MQYSALDSKKTLDGVTIIRLLYFTFTFARFSNGFFIYCTSAIVNLIFTFVLREGVNPIHLKVCAKLGN